MPCDLTNAATNRGPVRTHASLQGPIRTDFVFPPLGAQNGSSDVRRLPQWVTGTTDGGGRRRRRAHTQLDAGNDNDASDCRTYVYPMTRTCATRIAVPNPKLTHEPSWCQAWDRDRSDPHELYPHFESPIEESPDANFCSWQTPPRATPLEPPSDVGFSVFTVHVIHEPGNYSQQ